MVGDWGTYRRPAGINPSHKPKVAYPFTDAGKQKDFEKFTGNLFYDHPGTVVSENADGTVNLVVFGDQDRDTWEVRSVRNVSVSTTPSIGAFTVETSAGRTYSAPKTQNVDTSGEAQ